MFIFLTNIIYTMSESKTDLKITNLKGPKKRVKKEKTKEQLQAEISDMDQHIAQMNDEIACVTAEMTKLNTSQFPCIIKLLNECFEDMREDIEDVEHDKSVLDEMIKKFQN